MRVDFEHRLLLVVGAQFAPRAGNADAVALHQAGDAHRVRQVRVAVVEPPRLAERLRRHVAVRAAGVDDLHAVGEPRHLHGAVGGLVGAVHHGVARELLQRRQGIRGAPDLRRTDADLHRRADVAAHQRLQVPDRVRNGALETRAVDDGVRAVGSGETQELHVGARQEVHRAAAEHQHAEHGGGRVGRPRDHLRRGQPLLQRAVVAGEHVGVERAGQIEVLESRQVEVGERGPAHRARVEGRVPVAALLVEDALFLGVGQRPPGPHPYPDAPPEPHRRRVGGRDGHHRDVGPAERAFADGHHRRGQNVAVRLAVGELQEQGVVDLQARRRAVVAHADEDDPRTAVVRQIIREGADGLPHRARRVAVEGRLALREVRLDVRRQPLEFVVRVIHAHVLGVEPRFTPDGGRHPASEGSTAQTSTGRSSR